MKSTICSLPITKYHLSCSCARTTLRASHLCPMPLTATSPIAHCTHHLTMPSSPTHHVTAPCHPTCHLPCPCRHMHHIVSPCTLPYQEKPTSIIWVTY